MTYTGKIALVSGGTGDIGRALVGRLISDGLKVAFTYHTRQDEAEKICAEHAAAEIQTHAFPQTGLQEAREIIRKIKEQWGPINYLAACTGQLRDKSFVRMEMEDWQEGMQANLDAVFCFCRAAWFDLIKQSGNAIVTLSSISGLAGTIGQANYAAAKAGVIGLTRTLAREAGPFGVRANALAPGYIESRMTRDLPEAVKQKARQRIPLQRYGRPEEVAAAAAFLLSDEARYITGQTLVIDGGLV